MKKVYLDTLTLIEFRCSKKTESQLVLRCIQVSYNSDSMIGRDCTTLPGQNLRYSGKI